MKLRFALQQRGSTLVEIVNDFGRTDPLGMGELVRNALSYADDELELIHSLIEDFHKLEDQDVALYLMVSSIQTTYGELKMVNQFGEHLEMFFRTQDTLMDGLMKAMEVPKSAVRHVAEADSERQRFMRTSYQTVGVASARHYIENMANLISGLSRLDTTDPALERMGNTLIKLYDMQFSQMQRADASSYDEAEEILKKIMTGG